MSDRTRELECVIADLKQQVRDTEKERDALRNEIACVKEVEFPRKAQAVADAWKGKCERLEAERNALRAKIEAMEQQEPVAWMDKNGTLYNTVSHVLASDKPLYLASGAKGENK